MAALLLAAPATVRAQRGGGPPAPAETPREAAAVDLTGTWVSVISEDWPLRMLPPRKGDYTRLPITPEARKVADAWDPAADEASGDLCKGYGAPAIMRMPGRIRISWQDDRTMKMDLEAGSQTRLFHFGGAPSAASRQGHSAAVWEYTRVPPRTGNLKVVTSGLQPGYLRRNGVPYSADTTMTEYYHLMPAPNGDVWLTVVTEVRDPRNLREPFVQSTHFKKIADDAPFRPEPCSLS